MTGIFAENVEGLVPAKGFTTVGQVIDDIYRLVAFVSSNFYETDPQYYKTVGLAGAWLNWIQQHSSEDFQSVLMVWTVYWMTTANQSRTQL